MVDPSREQSSYWIRRGAGYGRFSSSGRSYGNDLQPRLFGQYIRTGLFDSITERASYHLVAIKFAAVAIGSFGLKPRVRT